MSSAPGYHVLTDREAVLHALYEAAELEHNLMCTYLYAAFSLKNGTADGLTAAEAEAVARWRRQMMRVAIDEMGHLAAVWNITSALGGSPQFGRGNFPVDPGYLPASVVVRLAPFDSATLQHFVYLERPAGSTEPDGEGFTVDRPYARGHAVARLTPMGINYATVGDFYATLAAGLRALVDEHGEGAVFSGDPALQISPDEVELPGANRVLCLKTALAALDAIVLQGEGAPRDSADSHFQRFVGIRTELRALQARNPEFAPAFPVATNPVLRRPPRAEGRVWLENPEAIDLVDLANASYCLMLRLLGYAYGLRSPSREKAFAVDLSVGLMHAAGLLAQRAARLPAGPSNPDCHAGMSFTALRDAAPLPPGRAARHFFIERMGQLAAVGAALRGHADPRARAAAELLASLSRRAVREFDAADASPPAMQPPASQPATATPAPQPAPASVNVDGVETVRGKDLELIYEGRRCIHARFCVTGGPNVFLANVKGPWIHPDAVPVARVVEIAHACPSGAIRYRRLDGAPNEAAPPVNLIGVRESGPYAFRGRLELKGEAAGFRATLCRCGASKTKPFCDNSHVQSGFQATGEPPSGKTDMLTVRDGVLAIEPQLDGPLIVRGNMEIVSGTGRVVARLTSAKLCRCGGSASKPFCDDTHARIGFRSSS
jgi:CDGSH-type Zn-finger protein/uncharacterized Fe-S cluster protein YjdI